MGKSKFDPFKNDIIDGYERGKTLKELAQKYNASPKGISHFLKTTCNIQLRPPNRGSDPVYSEDVEQQIVKAYLSNKLSVNSISDQFNISYPTVHSILKRHRATNGRRTRSPTYLVPEQKWQLGYIAGLLDGEGTVRCKIITSTDRVTRLQTRISIVNTNKEVIDWLHQYGGNVYKDSSNQKSNETHKVVYVWVLSVAADCHVFLKAILPYLIIKRERSQKAIAMIENRFGF